MFFLLSHNTIHFETLWFSSPSALGKANGRAWRIPHFFCILIHLVCFEDWGDIGRLWKSFVPLPTRICKYSFHSPPQCWAGVLSGVDRNLLQAASTPDDEYRWVNVKGSLGEKAWASLDHGGSLREFKSRNLTWSDYFNIPQHGTQRAIQDALGKLDPATYDSCLYNNTESDYTGAYQSMAIKKLA